MSGRGTRSTTGSTTGTACSPSANVAGLFEQLSAHTDLPARLLRVEGGERMVTDLRHLASLLHAQAGLGGGAPSLLAWLRERMREAERDAAQDDRSRRLETDDEAVQVWTVHRSKGLEYPVVYVPFLWTPPPARDEDVLVFHEAASGDRVIDVSDPKGPNAQVRADHVRTYLDEEAGGALRLAYVALTRARSQVVVWWVRGHDCHRSPLGRLLLGPDRAAHGDQAATTTTAAPPPTCWPSGRAVPSASSRRPGRAAPA